MKKCWKIKNVAEESTAEIYFYGVISNETWYGDEITPLDLAGELESLQGKDVLVRINSPGGDVFAGQAIHNLLKSYPGNVTVKIDGVAASAAVLIVCAAKKVIMPSNSLLMVHNPAVGLYDSYTADDLLKNASYLNTVKQSIINAYKSKVSLSDKELIKIMNDETWMTALEAKEKGFIDEIEDSRTIQDIKIENNVLIVNSISSSLAKFKNVDGLKRAMKGEENSMSETSDSILKKITNLLGMKQEGGDNADTKPQGDEFQRAVNEALEKESSRLTALDALKNGNPVIDEIVNIAKKGKQTTEDVKPYVEAINSAAGNPPQNKAMEEIAKVITENMNSGSEKITRGGGAEENEKEEEIRLSNTLAGFINKKNGREQNGRTH